MTLKVAIVGCGKIADAHVEEIQKIPSARLVAACDSEPLMAEQLAVRYGIPAQYARFTSMLEAEKPDVVHIATPPGPHLALATEAMEAGCHVMVEKPLTLCLADSRALVDRAVRLGRKLTTGYRLLFDPPTLALRQMIRDGVIGDPVHLESHYGYDLGGPFGAAFLNNPNHWVHALPGKLFHNTIDHLINKLPEFIAEDDPQVVAQTYRYSRMSVKAEIPDELRVMIRGGRTSAYATFSCHSKPVQHTFTLHGTKNTARVDYVSRTVTLAPDASLPSAIGRLIPPFGQARQFWREGFRNVMRFARRDYHFFSGLNLLLRQFYESILTDGPPPIPYRDILWVAAVMEEIFQTMAAQPAAGTRAAEVTR